MTLYLMGIGLHDEKDISLNGLEAIKKCGEVYLDAYTSVLAAPISKLEALYGKKIILADRDVVEKNAENAILKNAKGSNVAFLVVGDVFSATTHLDLQLRAEKMGINIITFHNASILTAIGETGLSLYNVGKITSIPFENKDITTPTQVLAINAKNGMHTLFLLDLDPLRKKFLSAKEGIEYLLALKNSLFTEKTHVIVCCQLGSKNQRICYGEAGKMKRENLTLFPQCFIVPGKLQFFEEEALERWK